MTRRGTYHVERILLKYNGLSGLGAQRKNETATVFAFPGDISVTFLGVFREKNDTTTLFYFSGGHFGDVTCDEERPVRRKRCGEACISLNRGAVS